MTEQWRPIPGYEGLYEVSDRGRVMSYHPPRERYPESPRLLKGSMQQGYPHVCLQGHDGAKKGIAVHRLLMLAFVGPRPEGQQVRHLDGDRSNCTLENLAYGTPLENSADAKRHGTLRNGMSAKTHCKYGHELSGENVAYKVNKKTGARERKCIACKREGIDRIPVRSVVRELPTHCKRGHEFTPENTYVSEKRAGRLCRTCQLARQREFYARKVAKSA